MSQSIEFIKLRLDNAIAAIHQGAHEDALEWHHYIIHTGLSQLHDLDPNLWEFFHGHYENCDKCCRNMPQPTGEYSTVS